jgi:hypothetical protein
LSLVCTSTAGNPRPPLRSTVRRKRGIRLAPSRKRTEGRVSIEDALLRRTRAWTRAASTRRRRRLRRALPPLQGIACRAAEGGERGRQAPVPARGRRLNTLLLRTQRNAPGLRVARHRSGPSLPARRPRVRTRRRGRSARRGGCRCAPATRRRAAPLRRPRRRRACRSAGAPHASTGWPDPGQRPPPPLAAGARRARGDSGARTRAAATRLPPAAARGGAKPARFGRHRALFTSSASRLQIRRAHAKLSGLAQLFSVSSYTGGSGGPVRVASPANSACRCQPLGTAIQQLLNSSSCSAAAE